MRRKYSRSFTVLLLAGFLLIPLGSAAFAGESPDVESAVQTAGSMGVPEEQLNHLLALGYKHDLKAGEVVQLVNVITEARSQDLPVSPLIGKMEEGLAKGADVRVIEQVSRAEMEKFAYVREIARNTLDQHGASANGFGDEALVRMTRVLSMGISRSELKGFLEKAPKAGPREVADSVEFLAALKQAGLNSENAEEVALAGLKSGFVSKAAWDLALTVHAAKKNNLSEEVIQKAALEVVRGEQSLEEALGLLGIDGQDLMHGAYITAPRSADSPPGSSGASRGGRMNGPVNSGTGWGSGAGGGPSGSGGPGGGTAGPGGAGQGTGGGPASGAR